tara:strand:- start:56 stop:274 length:219 start_codon:yes stop_codon:yes gene_type:complete
LILNISLNKIKKKLIQNIVFDKRYQKDAMDTEVFVYRVNQYDLNGIIIDTMFYYFDADTERLIKVDGGTRWN